VLDELLPAHLVDALEREPLLTPARGSLAELATADHVEDEVQDESADAAQRDAAAEHHLERGREVLEELGEDHRGERESEAHGDDEDVPGTAEVHPLQRLDAYRRDRAEERERRSPDDRGRDGGHYRGQLRQEPEDYHDPAGRGDHPPAPDPRQPDQPDVLGEAGVGEGVEDPSDERREPVGAQRAGDVPGSEALADDLAGREGVAGGLDHGYEHHDDHRDYRRDLEVRQPVVEGGGDPEPAGLRDLAEVRYPEPRGDQGAHGQPDQDRDRA
jgi:hypothetical protein